MSSRTPRVRGQSTGTTIRVALRIAAGPSPAYLSAAVGQLLAVEGTDVVLALVVPAPSADEVRSGLGGRLERAYERLERSVLRGGLAALAKVPPIRLPDSVQWVVGASTDQQAAALTEARVDVLVDLVADDTADALPSPPAGRWRLRYAAGDGGRRRARLAQPAAANGLAEAVLAIQLDGLPGIEACRGVGALHRIGFHRASDALYWRSAAFAARKLERLVAGDAVIDGTEPAPPAPRTDEVSRSGRPWGTPPFGALFLAIARRLLERLLFTTSWVTLVRGRNEGDGPPADLRGFRPVPVPAGRFYADPFVVADGTATHLYVEDCPNGRHRGRISRLVLGPGGTWAMDGVVLADLEHRAYPHVARTAAGLLMTPDSGRAGGVDIFRDSGLDGAWVPVGRCLDGVAASDPTLLEHDGRLWLFVAESGEGMDPWDELHLYSALDLDGPWEAHPRNPVVADARRARPAGRIFRVGSRLIRPGQDCSTMYGRRIVLNEITALTRTDYEERPVSSIEPTGLAGIRRTHTYSFAGTIDALDGYRREFRFKPGAVRARS